MIFRHTEWCDEGSLRSTCSKLGEAGLVDMLDARELEKEVGERTIKPIELHFDLRRHDLIILNAILSNKTIASRVETLLLGCLYLNEGDLLGGITDDSDEHRAEVISLLNTTLTILQGINKERKRLNNEKTVKDKN